MALTNKRGKGWIEVEGLGRLSDEEYERGLREGRIKLINNDKKGNPQSQNVVNMLTGEMMTTGIPTKREISADAYEEAKLPRSPLQELAERATFGNFPSDKAEEAKPWSFLDFLDFLTPTPPKDYLSQISDSLKTERHPDKVSAISEPRDKWGDLTKKPDYEEKSKYKSSYRGGEVLDPIRMQYLDNGYGDIEHDIINKDKGAKLTWLNDNGWNNQETNRINALELLDEKQLKNYNYIYNTEGKESAKEYLDYIKKDLNKAYRANTEKYWEEEGKKNNPLVNAAARTILNNNSLVESIPIATNRILKTGKLDPNDVNVFGSGIAAEALERGNSQKKKESGAVGEALYNVAETAEGIGEYMFMPFARILSAGSAFNNTVRRNLEKGLDEDEAIGLGAIAGGVQFALSKAMQKYTKLTPTDIIKDGKLVAVLKNMGKVYGIGEAADIINIVSDTLIASDKSNLERIKNGYVEQGMSEEEAWGRTIADAVLTTSAHNASNAAIAGLFATIRALGSKVSQVEDLPSTRVYREKAKPLGLEEGIISDVDFDPEGNMTVNQGVRETYSPYAQDAELNPDTGRYETGYQPYEEPTWDFEEDIPQEEFAYAPEEYTPQNDVNAEITALTPYNNKSTQSTMAMMYEGDMPLDVYVQGMNDYYIAGLSGEDINSVQSENGSRLTPIQQKAIYNKGKEDANELRIRESGKRNDGENPISELPDLEENTGRNQAWETQRPNPKDRDATSLEDGGLVPASDYGADSDGEVRLAKGETPTTKEATALFEGTGYGVTYTLGGIPTSDGEVNALVNSDTKQVMIQADDPDFTSLQFAGHEKAHVDIANGTLDVDETKNAIVQKYGANTVRKMCNDYASAYEGGLDPDDAFTEIICDAAGGMNIFEGANTVKAKEFKPFLNDVRNLTVYTNDNQTNAPPKKAVNFSRKLTPEEASKRLEELPSEEASKRLREKFGGKGDVQFSRKSSELQEQKKRNAQLEKNLEKQSEQITELKRQFHVSSTLRGKRSDAEAIAKQKIKKYNSDMPLNEVTNQLLDIGNYVLNASKDKNITAEEYFSTPKSWAIDLASELVNSSKILVEPFPEFKKITDLLSKGITISKEDRAGIEDFEGLVADNKKYIKVVNGGIPVKTVYSQLSKMFPELFPSDIKTPADQFIQIADVVEDLQPYYENPYGEYGYEMASIIEDVANEILEDAAFGQITVDPTMGDEISGLKKEIAKLRRLNEKAEEDSVLAENKLQALKEKMLKERAATKERYKVRDKRNRERREEKVYRDKIVKHAGALSKKLLKPTDKSHITEPNRDANNTEGTLRALTGEILKNVNLESTFNVTEEGGLKHAKEGGYPTKRTAAFRALRTKYEEIAKSGELPTDEAMDDYLKRLEELGNTPIGKLGLDDLKIIYNTLRHLEHMIEHANKLLASEQSPHDLAFKVINANKDKKEKEFLHPKQYELSMGMLKPQSFFHRLGEGGEEMFQMLSDANDKKTLHVKADADWFADNIKVNVINAEKDIHTIRLGNQNVDISTAGLMELYAHSKCPDNLRHALAGGIEVSNKHAKFGKAKYKKVLVEDITREQLANVENILRAKGSEYIKTVDAILDYFTNDKAAIGNKTSLAVYGYEKFNEDPYYPINVDRDYITSNSAGGVKLPTSMGHKGFTIIRKEEATQPIQIGSIFDTFWKTCAEMDDYAAFLPAVEDINRIRNYQYADEHGKPRTMKKLVNRVHGERGYDYWTKLMSDISNGVHSEEALFGGQIAKFKVGAVGANLSVIFQQPFAILRAMSMLDPKYFSAASMDVKRGMEKAKKYAPIALQKDWGYFDIGTGKSMRNLMIGAETPAEKLSEIMMRPAGWADNVAWGYLWNAVEAEIKATTDLWKGDRFGSKNGGTPEFYEACAKRFTQLINKTQVVDGILQRSELMRSGSWYHKMVTPFMGEPITQWNQLMDAIYDYRQNPNKKTGRFVFRTSVALFAAAMATALAKSVIGTLRHNKRDEDLDKTFMKELTGVDLDEKDPVKQLRNITQGNIADFAIPFNYMPYIKDLWNMALGYDIERADMSVFKDFMDSARKVFNSMTSDSSKQSIGTAAIDFLAQTAKFFGIPASNFLRDTKAIIDTLFNHVAGDEAFYNYSKIFSPVGSNKSLYYGILYNAWNNGNTDFTKQIVKDLVNSGAEYSDIQTALRKLQADELGYSGVSEMPDEYKIKVNKETGELSVDAKAKSRSDNFMENLEEKQTIKENTPKALESVQNSSLWKKATAEQQARFNSDVATDYNKKQLSKAVSMGVSEEEWMRYYLARTIVDKKNSKGNYGSYTTAEKKEAAQMAGIPWSTVEKVIKASSGNGK